MDTNACKTKNNNFLFLRYISSKRWRELKCWCWRQFLIIFLPESKTNVALMTWHINRLYCQLNKKNEQNLFIYHICLNQTIIFFIQNDFYLVIFKKTSFSIKINWYDEFKLDERWPENQEIICFGLQGKPNHRGGSREGREVPWEIIPISSSISHWICLCVRVDLAI